MKKINLKLNQMKIFFWDTLHLDRHIVFNKRILMQIHLLELTKIELMYFSSIAHTPVLPHSKPPQPSQSRRVHSITLNFIWQTSPVTTPHSPSFHPSTSLQARIIISKCLQFSSRRSYVSRLFGVTLKIHRK